MTETTSALQSSPNSGHPILSAPHRAKVGVTQLPFSTPAKALTAAGSVTEAGAETVAGYLIFAAHFAAKVGIRAQARAFFPDTTTKLRVPHASRSRRDVSDVEVPATSSCCCRA